VTRGIDTIGPISDSPVCPIVATEGSSTLKSLTVTERLEVMVSLAAKLQGHAAYLKGEVERAHEERQLRSSANRDAPAEEESLGED